MPLREKNPESLRYIIRIDHKATHGYQVRIPIDGKQVSKFFADGQHSGKRGARNAATIYRDKECKKLSIPLNNKRVIRRQDKRNKTGQVGVNIFWKTVGGYQYKYYVASWTPKVGENPKRKMFSAHRLGDDKAMAMAIQHRLEMEKVILGQKKARSIRK